MNWIMPSIMRILVLIENIYARYIKFYWRNDTHSLCPHCLRMSYSSKIRTVLYDVPLSPIFGKNSSEENGYYRGAA